MRTRRTKVDVFVGPAVGVVARVCRAVAVFSRMARTNCGAPLADHVEHCGVGLPASFLEHGAKNGWAPPALSSEQVLELDAYIFSRLS